MSLRTVLLVIALSLVVDHGVTQGVDNILNSALDECLQLVSRSAGLFNSTKPTLTDLKDIEMQSTCLQEFVWKFGGINWADFNITEHDIKYINDLMRSLVSEHNKMRVKRQAGGSLTVPQTGFRTRREYRRLSDFDRAALHNAIVALKQNGEYDRFANFHVGIRNTAHNGPNFLGWHRVYLALFEEALRRVNPNVALAYWDSTLDFDMNNPANSIIWSAEFLGNGDGFVRTGPFANWNTNSGRLARNIGGRSSLMSKEFHDAMMTRCLTSQITNPTATQRFNLERAHGGPHLWVGGQMRGLDSAAHDPVFFLHHAYIDYVWELFRIRQTTLCNVNPVNDYPQGVTQHGPNRPMDSFPQYLNIDGYREYWTQSWYRYESSPTCSGGAPACGSPYLTCNTVRGRCVSVARPLAGTAGLLAFGAASAAESSRAFVEANAFDVGMQFDGPDSDIRSADMRVMGMRRKRAIKKGISKVSTFIGDVFHGPMSDGRTSDVLGFNVAKGVPSSDKIVPKPDIPGGVLFPFAKPMPLISTPEFPGMMNAQFANGVFQRQDVGGSTQGVDDTVYVPVKVIYIRQLNKVDAMHSCQVDTNGAMRIHIRAQGLNYIGINDEYKLIDAKHAVSTSMSYMAVKLPTNKTSELLITATDGCGRKCQARCLDKNNAGRTFRNCNGVLHVDKNSTLGKMRNDAVGTGLRGNTKAAADVSIKADIQLHCPSSQHEYVV